MSTIKQNRKKYISTPLFKYYKKIHPKLSDTERQALEAGTVSWEGECFSGKPDWDKLINAAPMTLTQKEQDFIDGPLEELCELVNDWEVTHKHLCLPENIWDYITQHKFFAMIIPESYGGLGFSAYAQSLVLIKLFSRCITAAVTVGVPNSLGPGELLLDYGTEQQKNYYLPRLASGEDIPCFALTSPTAGSDAGSIIDSGIVFEGEWEGKKQLCLKLNFNKRYITLAPVATVMGLAFKLYDPEKLLSDEIDRGITCALIPTDTKGIKIGNRHFPLNNPFQNGPIQGQDVIVPLSYVIGGEERVGDGWRMLMECLAVGRGITLPASANGGSQLASITSGAYARVRYQFNTAIGNFEGIQEALARIAGYTYQIDATSMLTIDLIMQGEKPAVASAITKYHTTELARQVACDAMDIHGGKGICLGPKNYLGRNYQAAPVSITVEGANILTRSMMIFGQGAIRCHPYLYPEMEAAAETNPKLALDKFDTALFGHIGFIFKNSFKAFSCALTRSEFLSVPNSPLDKYLKHLTRFSAAYGYLSDISLALLGASLKRRESLSGRLGDILSYLYMASGVIKKFHSEGANQEDLPLAQWALEDLLFKIQSSFDGVLKNMPNKFWALKSRAIIFPIGQHFSPPSDKLTHKVAKILITDNKARDRLGSKIYLNNPENNHPAEVEKVFKELLNLTTEMDLIKQAVKDKRIDGIKPEEQFNQALEQNIINQTQKANLEKLYQGIYSVIAVDDYGAGEL